ncbi:MM3350-like domain-containing protein [Gaertneriomyces semiglobifer]|nr:MM3350-like domain-containing protein [Gaertneriomyces semiglobifer]
MHVFIELNDYREHIFDQSYSQDGQALFDSAVESIKAGKNEEAIVMLTQALKTCELDDELEADEDEDQEDPHASLRLRVLAARAGAAFNLKAYRSVIRDTELIERIYGRPMDVMNAIDDKEDLAAYFRSVLRSAQAYEALGDRQNAGAGYMAIMILKMITQQGEDEGQTIDLIAPEVADELTAVAGKALENLEADADKVPVYTLKISLLGVEPTIYRTLEVTGTTSLGDLKTFIVFAFGWAGFDELEDHEFQVYDHGIVRFTSLPDDFVVPDGEDSDILDVCEDEDTATLTLVAPKVGDTFTFHYEKADWVHQIVVENIREENIGCDHDHDAEEEHEHEHPQYPKCIAGARACPPDGLGGPAGYAEFLKAANGEATTKFATKLEALEYARDNLGLCNSGLDSWGGAVKRSLEAALTGEAVEEEEDDTPKDVEKGGWNSEAFDLEEVNKALTVISSTMQDDEDEWEDDDEEEEDVEEDI